MATQALVPTGFGTNDVQIMAGTFDEFSFDDVVQVLGLSRQCLRLLVRRGETALSEVLLKAGQVLDARMPASSDPQQVFDALSGSAVRGSGLSFSVYHTEPNGPFPVPRGRLSDLHARARAMLPSARPAPAPSTVEPTLQLTQASALRAQLPVPAPVPAEPPPLAVGSATGALTSPAAFHADTLGKVVAADLQPVLRQELNTVLSQVREHAQALHTMDGRLQALPQLVAAEIRLALAQRERESLRAAAAAPAPVAPAPAPATPWGLVLGVGAAVGTLVAGLLLLAARLLR